MGGALSRVRQASRESAVGILSVTAVSVTNWSMGERCELHVVSCISLALPSAAAALDPFLGFSNIIVGIFCQWWLIGHWRCEARGWSRTLTWTMWM